MRVPNKVNTKPFERLLKWKRKINIFDFKERQRKGKRVLFLSVRRKEIEAKNCLFIEKKGIKQGNKSNFVGGRKRGSKSTYLLLSPTGNESRI